MQAYNRQAFLNRMAPPLETSAARGLVADEPAPIPAPIPQPAPPPPSSPTLYKTTGFEAAKFDDPNRSEKYKIGDVLRRFDSRQGVTPDVLSALNALGIAEFSGGGDKLTVNNTKNDPRFGSGGTSDIIKGFKGQNDDTAWQPWFVDDGAGGQGAAAGQAAAPMENIGLGMAQNNLNALLQGSPYANIQTALGKVQQPNLQALLAQLGGM